MVNSDRFSNGNAVDPYDLFTAADQLAPTISPPPTLHISIDVNKIRVIPNLTVIPDSWRSVIDEKLQNYRADHSKYVSSLTMANHVASVFGYEQDRYLTGKPRTYFLVAYYMDHHYQLEVVDASVQNITYRLR